MLRALFRDRNAALDADVYALTTLTAIRPGFEAAVAAHIRSMSRANSPFSTLPATHFARLVVVDRLAEMPDVRHQHLLFSAVIDGIDQRDRDDYLESMCKAIPAEVNAIWGRGLGAPDAPATDPPGFAAWMAAHELRARAFYTRYGASVAQVRHALRVRSEVRRFAAVTKYLTPDALRSAVAECSAGWLE